VTPRYLLDTNVISEPLRPIPNPTVLARLQQHDGAIAIASVVWHELLFGSARLAASARRTAIERYLHQVDFSGLALKDWRG
jgi:tRNA(fMet)-specific endonuclease VapC